MARIDPPFHAPPAGPLTCEPLVEFNEQYDLTVPDRWDVNDFERAAQWATSPHPYRQIASNNAQHWHKEDQKLRAENQVHKRGPALKYPDNAPPGETPDERLRRRNREAQARWKAKHAPAEGAAKKPAGRPRKDAAAPAVVTLSVGQLRAMLVWCSQNSYTHDDDSLAAWLGSVGVTLPSDHT